MECKFLILFHTNCAWCNTLGWARYKRYSSSHSSILAHRSRRSFGARTSPSTWSLAFGACGPFFDEASSATVEQNGFGVDLIEINFYEAEYDSKSGEHELHFRLNL